MGGLHRDIDAADIRESVGLLRRYLDEEQIAPVICALEALEKRPEDPVLLGALSQAMDTIGAMQGAVLTYAPYLLVILSDDPFGDAD